MGRELVEPIALIVQCSQVWYSDDTKHVWDEVHVPRDEVWVLDSLQCFCNGPFEVVLDNIYVGEEKVFETHAAVVDVATFAERYPVRPLAFGPRNLLRVRYASFAPFTALPYLNLVLHVFRCPGCIDGAECPKHGRKFLEG